MHRGHRDQHGTREETQIFGLFYAFGGYAFYMSMHTNIRLDDYKKFFLIFPAMYLVVNLCNCLLRKPSLSEKDYFTISSSRESWPP